MEGTILNFFSNLAHTNFFRLFLIFAPLLLEQLNHVFREGGAYKNLFGEHFSSRKALKEIFKLNLCKLLKLEWVQNPEPNACQLLVCQSVVLEKASYFDIEIKVNSGVLVIIIDTKGPEYSTKYFFELVTAEIREFE